MQVFYSDTFELPLPDGHRFPAQKYRRLRKRLAGHTGAFELIEAPATTREQLARVHTSEYLNQVFDGTLSDLEQRRIGFPWSRELVQRSLRSAGGTLAAAKAAQDSYLAAHLAGGTHHGFADQGQGFCVFNDVAVAIRNLQAEQKAQRSVVIDCDVHQGNGTAAIFADDANVFTFSIHGAENFPFRKCNGDLDIALPNGANDATYLAELERAFEGQIPFADCDAAFYLAGADPFHGDRYGKLALTKAGLAERDRVVIEACLRHEIALTIVMAGGYANDIDDIVDIHAQTILLAAELNAQRSKPG